MPIKNLSKLKSELVFNQNLTRLIDTMKGIAAAQFHMVEQRAVSLELQARAIEELFSSIYDFRAYDHPFIHSENKRRLICLVTTDMGFLSGMNMKVIQAGIQQEGLKASFLVIGERGVHSLRELGKSYIPMPGISTDESRYELIETVIARIAEDILKKDYGEVLLVYPRAVSFTVQRIETTTLIPCPLFSKGKPEKIPTEEQLSKAVILESEAGEIIEYLTFLWMRKVLIEVFETAKLAEFGARTMHLEDSFQTLRNMEKHLKLHYFKARREKIDQNLRETFASQIICRE